VSRRRPETPNDHGDRSAAGSAALLVVLLAVSFQLGSALAVKVIESVGVVEATWLRQAFAVLLLGVIWLVLRRGSFRLPPKGRRLLMVSLSFFLLAMNLAFYAAIDRAPVGVVVAIEFLGPLSVAVAGTRRRVDWIWIGLAGLGVALLAGPTGSASATGLIFAFVSGGCWAAYLVLAKRAVTGVEPLTVTMQMIVGSAILITPVFVASGPKFVGYGHAIALAAVVAVVSSALPYLLELVALRRVRAATYGVLLSIEPAVAALAGFIVLGQTLSPVEILAIAAIVAAAAGASWTGGSRSGLDAPAI
jgi:inner membrane transporter RhtA